MELTTLKHLLKTGHATCDQSGLTVTIPPSWVVSGEDRLSYTTLVRLIECCREYHWQKDILSRTNTNNVRLDSICKSLTCDFISPILIGSTISISYSINEVRRKGYSMRFEVRDNSDGRLCATFEQISVFYEPVEQKPMIPPPFILEYLSNHIFKEVSR
jgi:acyl-CoA thioesterase FadM